MHRLFPMRAAMILAISLACAPPTRREAKNNETDGFDALQASAATITNADLARHTTVLASDEFEGRAPATSGEEKTVAYLVDQLKRMGLAPGNPDGSYTQVVLLGGFAAEPTASVAVGGTHVQLKWPDDYVAWSYRSDPAVHIRGSEMVFVGYGVVAPEYNWDDYKGVDVRGRTVVMLYGEPRLPDAKDPSKAGIRVFREAEQTYYATSRYKQDIALRKGAAAVVLVHEQSAAGFPFEAVARNPRRERVSVRLPDSLVVPAFMTVRDTRARQIFAVAGLDLDSLRRRAVTRDFRPVPLHARLDLVLRVSVREFASRNVVARLEGSDPTLRSEYIIYSAHWDHLGRDTARTGDQVYNGAVDNAGGTAQVLEIAEAFANLGVPPRRSILFLLTTAEEIGLLGARYYAVSPLYPIERTVGNINLDSFLPWGRTRDVINLGEGRSTLDDVLAEEVGAQGRTIVPDPFAHEGFYFRSDHLEFARVGVPSIFPSAGLQNVGQPVGFGQKKVEEYLARDYHALSDEVRPDWDWSGGVEDAQLLFRVGYRIAQSEVRPAWKRDSEFRTLRQNE